MGPDFGQIAHHVQKQWPTRFKVNSGQAIGRGTDAHDRYALGATVWLCDSDRSSDGPNPNLVLFETDDEPLL
jgi:hypothetical protein